MDSNLEIRSARFHGRTDLQPRITEHRGANGSAVLSGYAALFGEETVIGGLFRERVAPDAFNRALAEGQDVRHLLNHDANRVLGRSTTGTLRLSVDRTGLRYEVDLNPNDPDHVSVMEKVKRGDIDQSSFAFRAINDEWEHPKDGDDLSLRTLKDVDLYDTSTVTYPAYQGTTGVAVS